MINLDDIRKKIDDLEINHVSVKPKTLIPSTLSIDEFIIKDEFGNNLTIKLTEQGVGCLQWLWRGKKISDANKEYLSYGNFTNDISIINNDNKKRTLVERKVALSNFLNRYKMLCDIAIKNDELITFHVAIGNLVWGITRKYNIGLDHNDIIDLIEKNGYAGKIYSCGHDNKSFFIDLKIEDTNDKFVLRIQNGWTGHENLSYRVMHNFNYYQFESNLISKNRHLRKLNNTFNNLNDIMEELSKNNLTNKLAKINYDDFQKTVRENFDNRSKFNIDKYSSGDARKKLSKLSDKQVEKLERCIVNQSLYGNKYGKLTTSFDYINAITADSYSVKSSIETLLNAVLNEIFDAI